MKNTFLIILLVTSTSYLQAQLNDCSKCNSEQYTKADIEGKSLHELQLLRNEIFARHQYVFKNSRLEGYYSKSEWYRPDYDSKNQIVLNQIEKDNVKLFKNREVQITLEREKLFSELRALKRSLREANTNLIKNYIDLSKFSYRALTSVLNMIDLDNVKWYKDTALYKVSVDNGYHVTVTYLRVNGAEIKLGTGVQTHSEIISEPWKYGSDYFSEREEHSSIWIFRFEEPKLWLENFFFAG